MQIVLATHALAHPGGSETYALTLAEALERLGHDVTLHAVEAGPVAELAEDRGLRVQTDERRLPPAGAAIVQDAAMAYAMADRLPDAPQLFVAHSDVHDHQLPPQLPAIATAAVAMSDRTARRLAALERPPEIVRLTQPVDTDRFRPSGDLPARPRRALLLGNYLRGARRDALVEAWTAAGVHCAEVGAAAADLHPERAMAAASIVVGKGRVLLEAMACGRAAYLYDFAGTDGWVTPGAYPAMEADAFGGLATPAAVDPARLAADLDAYDPLMGVRNRDLVVAHHRARDHAAAVATVLARLAPGAVPASTPARELARVLRRAWASERRAGEAEAALERAHEAAGLAEERMRAAFAARDARLAERDAAREELRAMRRERAS